MPTLNVPFRAPVFVYESDEADRLATIVSTQVDLAFVESCCKKLLDLEEEEGVLKRALWSAALIAYVRCIWDGRRRWLHDMIKERIAELPGEPLVFHQWIKDMRDKNIAHSVNAFEEAQIGLLLPLEDAPEEEVQGVCVFTLSMVSGGTQDIENLMRVTQVLLPFLQEEKERTEGRITEEVADTSLQELRAHPMLRLTAPGSEQAGRAR